MSIQLIHVSALVIKFPVLISLRRMPFTLSASRLAAIPSTRYTSQKAAACGSGVLQGDADSSAGVAFKRRAAAGASFSTGVRSLEPAVTVLVRSVCRSLSVATAEVYQQFRDILQELPQFDPPSLTALLPDGSSRLAERALRSGLDVAASPGILLATVKTILSPSPGAAEALGPGFVTRLLGELLDSLTHLFENGQLQTSGVSKALHAIHEAVEIIFPDSFHAELTESVQEMWTALHSFVDTLQSEDGGVLVPVVSGFVGVWLVVLLLSALFRKDPSAMDLDAEYEVPKIYSPKLLDQYFANRQFLVWSRCLSVLSAFGVFYLGIQSDRYLGKLKENEGIRAVQLRNIIEKLGPTYVKVAQSLSTRVDILSKEYFAEIERLQDRVPPFSSEEAYRLLEQELGQKVEDVFATLTETTVASASLGQVYRGVLKEEHGGGEVAVKVQRPNVLSQVALDLYVARLLAIHVFPKVQRTSTNYQLLVDEYAVRFFQEMDYEQECENGVVFREQMASIEGEKLSESSAPDVRELCNTLLNVYLVQLLDTGFLHADPHPGNLIRTPEGKICIIDFGLMTYVTKTQRDNLVEYIANLTTMNWKGVAYSLKALGFIDANSPDPVEMGLVEPLEMIFSQIVRGGGAEALKKRFEEMPRLDRVRQQLEDLSKDFPFAVPTFFTLILRSFSVIEGIALGVDPDYSITMECFPYISRRILTDNDPRMNQILKGVLYGNKSHLDIERIERVSKALREFTVAGLPGGERLVPDVNSPVINSTIREALEVLFSPKGSYIQDLLVDEMVAATDAMSREALSQLAGAYMTSFPAMISSRTLEVLGPLRTVVFPFLTPTEIVERLQPALSVSKEDEEALTTVRGILRLVTELDVLSTSMQQESPSVNTFLSKAASELAPMIPDLLPGVARITELFLRKLASRVISRLVDALEQDSASEYSSSMQALE